MSTEPRPAKSGPWAFLPDAAYYFLLETQNAVWYVPKTFGDRHEYRFMADMAFVLAIIAVPVWICTALLPGFVPAAAMTAAFALASHGGEGHLLAYAGLLALTHAVSGLAVRLAANATGWCFRRCERSEGTASDGRAILVRAYYDTRGRKREEYLNFV